METLFFKFKNIIHNFINPADLSNILKDPLKSDFETKSLQIIERHYKVEVFFEEFEKIKSDSKYSHLIEVLKDISDWIPQFLLAKDGGLYTDSKLKIVCNLINLQSDFYVENLHFNKDVIQECLDIAIISKSNYEILLDILENDGPMLTKWKFLDIVHVRSYNCYSKFLYLSYKYNQVFVELFCEQLFYMLEGSLNDEDIQKTIQIYSNSIIADNIGDVHSGIESVAYKESQNSDYIPVRRAESIFHSSVSTLTNNQSRPPINNSKLNEHNLSDNSDDDDDENIDFNNLFGEVKNKEVKDILNFKPEIKSAESEILNVRKYQQELADSGIKGHNVLICAPTGSGKTIVAIKIVEEHFRNNLEAKVVFIVPTNSLVDQQYRQFHKYLKNRKIVRQSGDTKPGNVPLSIQIPGNEIFIVTSDILKNMLENYDENQRSIKDFTMIIFDECHHCLKGHSYNKLMDFYFKVKEKNFCVPQIIGMTASTGTDKAKKMETAMENLYSLCANLDCKIVATVKMNLENLKANQNIVKEEILTPEYRFFDDFEDGLLDFMRFTEGLVENLFGNYKTKSFTIPDDKWHDKYLNFISSLSKSNSKLFSDQENKEIRNLAGYLEILYRALLINNLFTSKHSRALIETLKTDIPADFEKHVQSELKNFLSKSNLDQDENPSLECLKSEISKQLQKDKKSRIIIFVKEVKYAKILAEELESAKIDSLKCSHFVGTNKPAEKGGSTTSAINDTLAKFEKGLLNVICCTSVAEEGIDIEKCNLVIRYGIVTNETSRVQTRGRARAENSRYLIIIPYKLDWMVRKETINKFRETMMYKAIENFQMLNKNEISKKIDEFQLIRQFQSTSIVHNKTRTENNGNCDIWSIHCGKCEKYLCDAKDIRIVNGNSYVVINKNRFSNLPVKEKLSNSSLVICKECNYQVGVTQKHDCVSLPVLQVRKIMFKSSNGNDSFSQWKFVPFKLLNASSEDLLSAYNTQY